MADCPTCELDMLAADSCTPRPDAVVYGTEIDNEPGEPPYEYQERCGDCEVTQGSTHHFGCAFEWCGPCAEQRLTCDHTIALLESRGDPQVPNL